jgi:GTP cyclohydrolase FolE2
MNLQSCCIDLQSISLCPCSSSFSDLNTFLEKLEEERIAAMAAAAEVPLNEKRGAMDPIEPETKKKAKVSRGVKSLEKVSTRGMKDMRSFFKKPSIKTKA